MYLFKVQNVFVQMVKCICPKCKMFLSKWQNVYVQSTKRAGQFLFQISVRGGNILLIKKLHTHTDVIKMLRNQIKCKTFVTPRFRGYQGKGTKTVFYFVPGLEDFLAMFSQNNLVLVHFTFQVSVPCLISFSGKSHSQARLA